jgi:type III pantothenate kinase
VEGAAGGTPGRPASLVLLIGNTHWHWGRREPTPGPDGLAALRCWSTRPPERLEPADRDLLLTWAAVGPVPAELALLPWHRLTLAAVPLQGLPAWLGIDRALVGWGAWQRQLARLATKGRLGGGGHSEGGGGAVLVADAGTALSLTRVSASGAFAGGRLLAGAGLQLAALTGATALLPQQGLPDPAMPLAVWPSATGAAMASGCLWGLAHAIAGACRQHDLEPPPGLWLTGGDGPRLAPLLQELGQPFELVPDLALEALDALSAARLSRRGRSGPDR